MITKEKIIAMAEQAKYFSIPLELFSPVEIQEEIHPVEALYYRFFYHLSNIIKPKLCLELGTNKGVAAACLAIGNPQGRVVTIDIEKKPIYKRCQLKNIDFWNQDSLAKPKEKLLNIDILFIDTSSKGSRNKAEYDFWFDNVSLDGLIFIDDIYIVKDHTGEITTDKMAEFWNSLNPQGEKIELPLHGKNGFGLVIKK